MRNTILTSGRITPSVAQELHKVGLHPDQGRMVRCTRYPGRWLVIDVMECGSDFGRVAVWLWLRDYAITDPRGAMRCVPAGTVSPI